MKRIRILALTLVLVCITIALIYSYNDRNLEIKYYEAFSYKSEKNRRHIIFINQLKSETGIAGIEQSNRLSNRWYIKVYYDIEGNWVKFENISPGHKIYETIWNRISIEKSVLN